VNDFPWTPQHEQPVEQKEVIEEVPTDSPVAEAPVVEKTSAKTRVKKAGKAKK
jgi:hypothetical protein